MEKWYSGIPGGIGVKRDDVIPSEFSIHERESL